MDSYLPGLAQHIRKSLGGGLPLSKRGGVNRGIMQASLRERPAKGAD